MKDILNYYFPYYTNGMMYMEETNDSYDYYKGIPGLSKEDLSIKQLIERDFVSILIKSKEETLFVEKIELTIVKSKEVVDISKEVVVKVDKGILTIVIPKKYPVKEIEL